MSAATLREAANLMRERAENSAEARVGPLTWTTTFGGSKDAQTCMHYQSWRPDVALAVADWLEREADVWDGAGGGDELTVHALAVARAYLGKEEGS